MKHGVHKKVHKIGLPANNNNFKKLVSFSCNLLCLFESKYLTITMGSKMTPRP